MTKSTLIAKSLRCAALLASTAISTAALANDLPTGGEVAAGSVSIGAPAAGNMTITQHSDRAVVNWTSFSVGEGHAVNIAQPTANSALLNRVTGDATSVIAGQINANGQVFLVNPNGIAITKSGTVNAAAFTASTLDIADRDFMAGGDVLTVTARANAHVMRLRAGLSDLMSPDLADGTLLVAGVAKMDGSDQAALDLTGDGFLRLGLPTGTIDVAGTINADTVVLTAGTARDAARGVVNLSGVINATGVDTKGGVVRLTGDVINLTGATIDASGTLGGGSIAIGGGYQGTGNLAHATDLNVDAGSTIRADALRSGDGGDVVLWSDHKTAFAGTITARGGANGGNGGNAEVSGKALLAYEGFTNLLAPKGKTGNLLLDPYNVTISSAANSNQSSFTATGDDSILNVTKLTNALGSANVTVSTGSGGSQEGNITVATAINWNAATTLELSAAGSIAVNADISNTADNAGLILRADNTGSGSGTVTFSDASASLSGEFSTVDLYYNPTDYATPTDFSGNVTSGELTSWMLVNTLQDLQDMNTNLPSTDNTHFKDTYALSKDIDASDTAGWNNGLGFEPIGGAHSYPDFKRFTGKFDGQGHVISGLTINRPNWDRVGLFGFASNASISNVGLEGGSISGYNFVGGLVGLIEDGTISNAYATGAVSGKGYVGGLVGIAEDVTISNAYATGAVSGESWLGGLVAKASNMMLSNANATGRVSGYGSNVGGLVGYAYQGTISDSYWDQYSTTQTKAIGSSYGATATVNAVTSDPSDPDAGDYAFNKSAYADFDLDNDWFMIEGSTRPFGRWEYAKEITNSHQLQLMVMDLAASYTLGADIDLSETGAVTEGDAASYAGMWSSAGWSPIGDSSKPFTGKFDGQGHVISELTINRPTTDQIGLFGFADYLPYHNKKVPINNIGLENVSVRGQNEVGGLIGNGSSVGIDYSYVTGSVWGQTIVGGLAGYLQRGSSLANAYATVSVSGYQYVGGLVGYMIASSQIYYTYANGKVSGNNTVGGLIGRAEYSSLSNSYWDSYKTRQLDAAGYTTNLLRNTNISAVTSDQSQAGAANYALKASAWNNFQTAGASDIDTVGGQSTTWRMYDGYTTPLLKAFMTKLDVTMSGGKAVAYNGEEQSLTPTFALPTGADAALVKGSLQTIRGTNAGTYTTSGLYSVQQGYDLVVSGSGSLTINPAQLTVTYTADAASRAYGAANGTLSGSYETSGLVGQDKLADIVSGAASWASTADQTTGAGSYAITGSGIASSNSNYTIKAVQAAGNAAALTINPAQLTVTYTAKAGSRIYGDANGTFSGSYEANGLVGKDRLADIVSGTASWASTADQTTGVGSYAITGSGIASNSANYTVKAVQADANAEALTITKRAITVTADDLSRIYGEANPALTYTVGGLGLVNGDTLSGSLSTQATAASNVDGYVIDASALEAGGNYDLTVKDGTLTITKRAITVTADDLSRIYGEANPALTYTVGGLGLVNGDQISGALTTQAGVTSNVDTYVIDTAALDAGGNYDLTGVNGTLTVTRRALTVTYTADGVRIDLGEDLPALGGSVSSEGLVNGDELTGTASWSTTATGDSQMGSYAITGSGLGASDNYDLTEQQAEGNATAFTIVQSAAPIVNGPAPGVTAGTLYGGQGGSSAGMSGGLDAASPSGGVSAFESIEQFCEDGSC